MFKSSIYFQYILNNEYKHKKVKARWRPTDNPRQEVTQLGMVEPMTCLLDLISGEKKVITMEMSEKVRRLTPSPSVNPLDLSSLVLLDKPLENECKAEQQVRDWY